jgi:predicted SprT family Zn-dependent metalloprotease
MEIQFECECGETVSHIKRGSTDTQLQYVCDGCETVYAVSITPIKGQHA